MADNMAFRWSGKLDHPHYVYNLHLTASDISYVIANKINDVGVSLSNSNLGIVTAVDLSNWGHVLCEADGSGKF